MEVIKLNSDHQTAETMERRKRKVEDVQKRAQYRKAHGLEKEEGFGGWTAKSNGESLGPAIPVGDAEGVNTMEGNREAVGEQVVRQTKPLKKWLGIW
jgi:hypothetical protein